MNSFFFSLCKLEAQRNQNPNEHRVHAETQTCGITGLLINAIKRAHSPNVDITIRTRKPYDYIYFDNIIIPYIWHLNLALFCSRAFAKCIFQCGYLKG